MPDPNSFDDLLGTPPTEEEKSAVTDLQDGGVTAETAEQARIRQLEETIARLEAQAADRPTPPTAQDVASLDDAASDDIVFHVLVNGLTIAGSVRHPGETVRIRRDSEAYHLATNRSGYNWLTDLSEEGQIRHFGRVVLGEGPFLGKTPDDALAQAERARRGSALSRIP